MPANKHTNIQNADVVIAILCTSAEGEVLSLNVNFSASHLNFEKNKKTTTLAKLSSLNVTRAINKNP